MFGMIGWFGREGNNPNAITHVVQFGGDCKGPKTYCGWQPGLPLAFQWCISYVSEQRHVEQVECANCKRIALKRLEAEAKKVGVSR